MAAYCRVSTDQEEQLLSYENQVNYYTKFIKDNPLYTFAGVYADEGISATNTKKREEFNRMIADCRDGKIDMIITKSISRFARNTLDCLNYVRELKELGIGILFEKENINTLDAKGEVLLTILSSLAQDESRSISENSTWGIRRRFETGKHKMSTKRFLGYDSDETGKLIVNSRQAKIVVRLFQEFLDGKTTDYIKRIFEREGVVNWDGSTKWHATTMNSMLQNEKYKGDALLQKSYTVDFLTKKKKKNNGELTQYYITDNHPAIIPREDFLNAQLELARRNSKKKVSQKKTKSVLGKYCSKYALSERLVCGECGSMYRRTTWSKKGKKKIVWRCINRLEFGKKYCQHSPTLSEEALHQAILQCVQTVAGDKDDIMQNLRDVQENIILFSGSQVMPQSLEKQISKLEQEMSALVKIVAQGGDSDFYAAKLRQLSEQKMDLTSQLQETQKKKIENQALEYQYQQALIYINNEENMNLTEFNDDFIRRIIEQVTVLSASQIRIRFVGGYELDASMPLQK